MNGPLDARRLPRRARKRSAPGLPIRTFEWWENIACSALCIRLSVLCSGRFEQRKGKLADKAGKRGPQMCLTVVTRACTRGDAKRRRFCAEVR
jgi:hypothetical protein